MVASLRLGRQKIKFSSKNSNEKAQACRGRGGVSCRSIVLLLAFQILVFQLFALKKQNVRIWKSTRIFRASTETTVSDAARQSSVSSFVVPLVFKANSTSKLTEVKAEGVSTSTDGLKNPKIAFIIHGSVPLIKDALITYLAFVDPVFIVVTEKEKEIFSEICKEDCAKHGAKLITVPCDEKPLFDALCCKQDHGLSAIWKQHGGAFDWYVYYSSALYIRTQFLVKVLEGVDPYGQPIIFTPANRRPLGVTWGPTNHQSHCSEQAEYKSPWGDPVVYSHDAMTELVPGAFAKNALQAQCQAFRVSQDAGSAIIHWMFELPQISLPSIASLAHKPVNRPNVMGYVAVWTGGKGHIEIPTLLQFHQRVDEKRNEFPKGPYKFRIHQPRGYRETSTYVNFGSPKTWKASKWHTLPVGDCGQNISDSETNVSIARPREMLADAINSPQKIAYITYGALRVDMKWRFQMYIIDALNTYLQDQVLFFVFNKQWVEEYELLCGLDLNSETCKRVIPIVVDCPEGLYGVSPCCKQDQGMSAMAKKFPDFDWYIYQDDDMYIRTAFMADWLAGLSPNETIALTAKELNKRMGVAWGDPQYHTNCSDAPDYIFPMGQPIIYSRAALQMLLPAFEKSAVTKQCKEFKLTHDRGNSIVHWMYAGLLTEVHLPPILSVARDLDNSYARVGFHAVGSRKYPNVKNMLEVHKILSKQLYPKPPYEYKYHRPLGFFDSSTYKKYGHPVNWTTGWHTMPEADCRGPPNLTVSEDNPHTVSDDTPKIDSDDVHTIAFITYGRLAAGDESRFQMYLIDALHTYLENRSIFYVLNQKWSSRFTSICDTPANRDTCKRIIPIFVNCTEGYYGKSPCCKMDQGLAAMYQRYPNFDWYIYQDDDMYIRVPFFAAFLQGLSPNQEIVLSSQTRNNTLGVNWGPNQTNCSTSESYKYPMGQPIVYSRATLRLLYPAFSQGAVEKQCEEFEVTHDVGNAIVHWMFTLPEIHLPPIGQQAIDFLPQRVGYHGVGRFRENSPNMTALHEILKNVSWWQPPYRYPKVFHPQGFLNSQTHKLHGHPRSWNNTWHVMPVSDCREL